jgi:hypothetical protein
MAASKIPPMQQEERKEGLSEAKRRLLEQRLRGSAPGSKRMDDSIRPRPKGASIPLSAEQRRVWLHAAQQPDVPIYNEPCTIYRYGSLDLDVLQRAFLEILRAVSFRSRN